MLGQDSLNVDPNHSSEFKISQSSGVKVNVPRHESNE